LAGQGSGYPGATDDTNVFCGAAISDLLLGSHHNLRVQRHLFNTATVPDGMREFCAKVLI
jgi:hypothetical protein